MNAFELKRFSNNNSVSNLLKLIHDISYIYYPIILSLDKC